VAEEKRSGPRGARGPWKSSRGGHLEGCVTARLREPPAITEDPTDETIALIELLALVRVIQEAWIGGVSIRRVDEVVQATRL
jgi:hypothetical protein